MSGWDTGSAGIAPERVAELLVDLGGPEPGRRGSGYRISASAVLTAAHVVRDAARVRVRFNADRPGEWMTDGTVAWSDMSVDAAVVTIMPRPRDEGKVAPVVFGRVAERDAVLTCSAMGFPRFKLRNDPAHPLDDSSPSQYRDSVHAVGTIAVLSNRRQGTLEVSVPPPDRDPDPHVSPWQGMSGAAVFSAGRIIGLVAQHHRADGLGRLAASRMDRWYERLAADRLEQLREVLPELPVQPAGLLEVVPPTAGELVQAGYLVQVRDIAPEQLVGRKQEFAELVQFCAGNERYQWWQAEPWAGKSALTAWFVLHPPAGVTIVSFFVTGRLAGQADSDAFTEAMVEQLAALVGEGAPRPSTAGGWDRERRRLLDLAAAGVGDREGRLLLVIDGLDEDEGAKLDSGKPSIASLLPKRPPDAVRVLVLSRSSPGIPGDVGSEHPLRHCGVRKLDPWSEAHDVRLRAKQELLQQLHGDQLQVDVIGFITAAGGGLALTELAELTGQPKYLLEGKLGSIFGRSLKTRLQTDRPPKEPAERVYLFAHETLRTIAEEQLAGDLGPYRQRIDAWADTYRAGGWPKSTPRYLLRPFGRLLATHGDLQRLGALATDPARQDRMLVYTQGDASALAEITTTQELILRRPIPDLTALGPLAIHRDRLVRRNQAVPAGLPALWARLGRRHRAEALARSIPNHDVQAWALRAVVEAMASTGHWDRAEQLAHTISNLRMRAWALRAVAKAVAEVDRGRALSLAADVEQAVQSITNPDARAWAVGAVVEALASAREWNRAEQTARSITDPVARAWAVGAVAKAVGDADERRALSLATDAEQIACSITNPDAQGRALRVMAEARASADQFDRAEQIAYSITSPDARARALSAVAKALADVDRDRALSLAIDAEQAARTITNPDAQATSVGAVVEALASTGQWDRAEQVVHDIAHFDVQAVGLRAMAKALARAGQWDRAEQVALSISNLNVQAGARRAMVEALASIGQWDRAEQIAHGITNPGTRAGALSAVAKALADVDRDRALSLAADAEQAARRVTDPEVQGRVLRVMAEALANTGEWDRAEQAAQSIVNRGAQARALRAVTKALVTIGQLDRAEEIAESISDVTTRAGAIGAVARQLAGTGQADRAERLARSIANSGAQAWALGSMVEALAGTGQWKRAEQIARSIIDLGTRAKALGTLAKALADVDQAQALSLAADAEQVAKTIAKPVARALGLSEVAKELADVDQAFALSLAITAEEAARTITNPEAQARTLSSVVQVLVYTRQWNRAEQIARSITNFNIQARAVTTVVEALAHARQWDSAEQIARSITNPLARASAMVALSKAIVDVDKGRALSFAADAEKTTCYIANAHTQVRAVGAVVQALAHAGQWDRAEQLTRTITNPEVQARAYTVLANIWAASNEEAEPDDAGEYRGARRGLGIVLAGDQWLEAIPVLGNLDRTALVTTYEALQGLTVKQSLDPTAEETRDGFATTSWQ
jgi:tetratricopeptide (TPR) repeat protein